jgi:hypothetical protein
MIDASPPLQSFRAASGLQHIGGLVMPEATHPAITHKSFTSQLPDTITLTRPLSSGLDDPWTTLPKGEGYLRLFLPLCLTFHRYTKPIPESLFQQVKRELFDGELTDEENEPYVPPEPSLSTNPRSFPDKFQRRRRPGTVVTGR